MNYLSAKNSNLSPVIFGGIIMYGFVYAVGYNTVTNTGLGGITSLRQVFIWVLNLLIGAGWSIVIIFAIAGAAAGMGGDSQKRGNYLTYVIVGGLGLALVTALRAIIGNLSGANIGVNDVTI